MTFVTPTVNGIPDCAVFDRSGRLRYLDLSGLALESKVRALVAQNE
jgi:hypothetical protein